VSIVWSARPHPWTAPRFLVLGLDGIVCGVSVVSQTTITVAGPPKAVKQFVFMHNALGRDNFVCDRESLIPVAQRTMRKK